VLHGRARCGGTAEDGPRPGSSPTRAGRRGAKLAGSYSAGDWLRPTWRARAAWQFSASTPDFP
jgi:hypothetical protein